MFINQAKFRVGHLVFHYVLFNLLKLHKPPNCQEWINSMKPNLTKKPLISSNKKKKSIVHDQKKKSDFLFSMNVLWDNGYCHENYYLKKNICIISFNKTNFTLAGQSSLLLFLYICGSLKRKEKWKCCVRWKFFKFV